MHSVTIVITCDSSDLRLHGRIDRRSRGHLKLRVAYSLLPPSFLSLWYTDRMFLLFTSCKIGVKGKKDEYMVSILEGRPLTCPIV